MFHVLIAFGASLLLLLVLARAAHRYGLVDRPSPRKTHLGEIPVVGGIAVGGAFLATAFILNPATPWFMPFVAKRAVTRRAVRPFGHSGLRPSRARPCAHSGIPGFAHHA